MNGAKHIIAFISCLLALSATSQSRIVLRSAVDSSSVPHANISWKKNLWTTDKAGSAYLNVPFGERVEISHISFRDTSIGINKESERFIYLKPSSNILSGVTISDKPYAVFAPEKEHVFDYCFRGDTLLVLTYEKERMMRKVNEQSDEMYVGCALVVISPTGNIIASLPLPDFTTGFHHFENTFVLGLDFCKVLRWKDTTPYLQNIDRSAFEEKIMPVKAVLKNQVYFDDFRWHYPEFTYFRYDITRNIKAKIRTICDDFTMELFRASYKYLKNRDKLKAWRMEMNTGVDKEVYAGYMAGFQKNLFYRSTYAPLFLMSDTLYIFDHYSDYIYRHHSLGTLLDSIPISYHRDKNFHFSEAVVKDSSEKRFWVVGRRGGKAVLKTIDLHNGKVEKSHSIYHIFPENIQVNKGHIYYIYRRTGSKKTKHLFVERVD